MLKYKYEKIKIKHFYEVLQYLSIAWTIISWFFIEGRVAKIRNELIPERINS